MTRYKTTGTRKRQRPKNAPTHVGRLGLDATPSQDRVILVRENAIDRVYNTCLAEALHRLERLRSDPRFETAKAMPKGKERTRAFSALEDEHGFTNTALMSYASSLRSKETGAAWVREHVGAQEAQAEGRKAFGATRRWSLGLGGRPKFRRHQRRKVRSAECKDLQGDICPVLEYGKLVALRWKDQVIALSSARPGASTVEQEEHRRIEEVIRSGGLLYCRVVSRSANRRWCHEAQFVLDGPAPLRHQVGSESKVSIDLGPSFLHVVHDSGSRHIEIAPSVEDISRELRRLLRKLDRQHRAGSPECFDDAGQHVSGTCHWKVRSKSARETQCQITECYRVMAARRDSDHGRVANELMAISPHVRVEGHGTKSWQKAHWSRSVARRGPGGQVARLERASIRATGSFTRIDSRLGLSQTCVCGARVKKPLSERRHRCEACGLDLDRDLFSAFLESHVVIGPDGCQYLDLDAARQELFGDPASALNKREQDGVPARAPLLRQDLGAGPERTLSGQEKQRVRRHHPPGRRSLVRIRRRLEAKAKKRCDRAARLKGGVAVDLSAANQSLPTAKAA
jgi:putative transposase